ncbi:hypothetical protein [Cohnella soli]|uniref:Zinc ribbon domain-containing protein n=1 Tax=Cohnella soli TaxID=425005 RepID=A0ABW0I4G4_9BACL
MYCAECGEKLVVSAIACPSCGTEIKSKPPAEEAIFEFAPAPVAAAFDSPASDPDPFAGLPQGRTFSLSTRAKVLILVLLAVGAALYLVLKFAGGGGGTQSTPEGAVKGFIKAAQAEKAEKMVAYAWWAESSDVRKQEIIKRYEEMFEADTLKIHDYEILSVKMEENYATVEYSMRVSQDHTEQTLKESFQLAKHDDKWYLDVF